MRAERKNTEVQWSDADTADREFLDACHDLFKAQVQPGFYHHTDWLLAANRHLLENSLQLGLVRDQHGSPLMMLPLLRAQGRQQQLPAHDHLSLNDVLVHPGLSHEALSTSLSALKDGHRSRWASLGALNVPSHSALVSLAQHEPSHWLTRHGRDSAWFDLNQQPLIPGKLRRNLTRLRKKLTSQHRVDVHVQEPLAMTAISDQAFDDFLAVEASGWKSQGDATAIALSDSLVSFYRALLTPQRDGLTAVINRLQADEQTIAVQFGLHTQGSLSLLKIGYDECWQSYSPGSLLLLELIGALQADNTQDIQRLSLVTSPAWADRWHPQTDPVWHMNRYASTPTGQAQRWKQQTKTIVKQQLRSIKARTR